MNYKFLVFLLIIFSGSKLSAQIFRYRLSANSSIFNSELGEAEISHPSAEALTYEGSSDFSPGFRIGAEAEIMAPVTPVFEAGLEFDFINLYGHTETPPLHNFFLSRHNPLPDSYPYPSEDLIYKTKQFNILGTGRFYFLPPNSLLNIFMKAHAGVAFTGTDLTFRDPYYRVEYDVGVLYARGTRNSEYPKQAKFSGGAGFGITYELYDKIDLYVDGTASFTNSDIVNGVPNFDYSVTEGRESLNIAGSWAMVSKINIGILYSAIPDRRMNRSRYTGTKSRNVRKNPFWKKNHKDPFKKRKRK